MNLAANHTSFLETYNGSKRERRDRAGIDYNYQIRLRRCQKDRMEDARVSTKQKKEREVARREFLLKNIVNQRWPVSLQWVYQQLNLNSSYYSNNSDRGFDISANQGYCTNASRRCYVAELIKMRRSRAAKNLESEFRNPLFVPLRGLDEDENDRDYMRGKEIRRELRNTADFEMMFDKYICEREEVADELGREMECMGLGGRALSAEEVKEGLKELMIERKDDQSDEEFFIDCLEHSWAILSQLNTPDFSGNLEEIQLSNKTIRNLAILIQIFKTVYNSKIVDLDSSIFTLALSHHLLNLNHFWGDLRELMRDKANSGLKSLVLTIGLQSQSQVIQEALIELVHDLSFSDFGGKKVNNILYEECLEVVEKWLKLEKWISQQTYGCLTELIEDLVLSQAVYLKSKEEKVQFSLGTENLEESDSGEEEKEEESEEEEKEMEHGMEDITEPFDLKSGIAQKKEKSSRSKTRKSSLRSTTALMKNSKPSCR